MFGINKPESHLFIVPYSSANTAEAFSDIGHQYLLPCMVVDLIVCPLCVLRVCCPLSCSLLWFILGVLLVAITMPTSNRLVMASGTVSTINTSVRSVICFVLKDHFMQNDILNCITADHQSLLFFWQITQDDIRKTYGGSSGSRGYYSSAFARSVQSNKHTKCNELGQSLCSEKVSSKCNPERKASTLAWWL